MKRVLIIGGNGLVGRHLTQHLLASRPGWDVRWLTRAGASAPPPGVSQFSWSVEEQQLDERALEDLDSAVYCAGYPLFEGRLDDAHKEKCRVSRIGGVQLLKRTLGGQQLDTFIGVSAIGIYGAENFTQPRDEYSAVGNDWPALLCRDWEAEYSNLGCKRRVIARLPPVLATDGGAYPQMALAAKFGLAAGFGSGEQIFPWIHVRDLSNFFLRALEDKALEGPFNVVAPSEEQHTHNHFTARLAASLSRPHLLPNLPEFAVNALMGSEVAPMLLRGGRISNARLDEAHFAYDFPTLDSALGELATQ